MYDLELDEVQVLHKGDSEPIGSVFLSTKYATPKRFRAQYFVDGRILSYAVDFCQHYNLVAEIFYKNKVNGAINAALLCYNHFVLTTIQILIHAWEELYV